MMRAILGLQERFVFAGYLDGTNQNTSGMELDFFSEPVRIVCQIIIALLILWLCIHIGRDLFNKFKKPKSVEAKIVSKTDNEYNDFFIARGGYVPVFTFINKDLKKTGKEYYLIFETEDGERIPLVVPEDVYEHSEENSKGILRYKGEKYIEFVEK